MTEIILEINTLWICIVIVLVFFIPLFAMVIISIISTKIHNSFHKGYREGNNDNLQYYSTLKILTDDFSTILNNLKKDNIKTSILTTDLLIKFKNSLENLYNI